MGYRLSIATLTDGKQIMPRLPTVKIVHKKTGQRRKMNALDYAADVGRWRDWKLISQSDGSAANVDIADARREQKATDAMRRDPEREKKFGDKQRAQDERSPTTSNETASAPVREHLNVKAKDWTGMKWADARQYIHGVKGSYPKSKKHAHELMGTSE